MDGIARIEALEGGIVVPRCEFFNVVMVRVCFINNNLYG